MTSQELIALVTSWRAQSTAASTGALTDPELLELAQDIHQWLADISVTGPNGGTVAIVYDGDYGDFTAKELAEDLAHRSNGERYTIGDTQAGTLLESQAFMDALVEATGSRSLAIRLMYGPSSGGLRSRTSIGDVPTISDFLADRFAGAVTGNVITINGEFIHPTSVFALSTLPALIDNPNVVSINGIEPVHFRALRDVYDEFDYPAKARELVLSSSVLNSPSLSVSAGGAGLTPLFELVASGAAYYAIIRPGADVAHHLGLQVGAGASTKLDVLSFLSAAHRYADAMRQGDYAEATQVATQLAVSQIGSWYVGRLAVADISSSALIAMAPLGLGAVAIAGLIFGVAYTTDKFFEDLFSEPMWNSEAAIRAAELDSPMGVLFRHALQNLDPLAIFSKLPVLEELKLFDPATGDGTITKEWIRARSELLLYYAEYLRSGAKDGEAPFSLKRWLSEEGHLVFSDPLLPDAHTLYVRNDLRFSTPERYTRFGNAEDNTLAGGELGDKLFGEDGNDVLIGLKDGDDELQRDRLEGGLGNDTYIYNKGDGQDVILDVGGLDEIFIDGVKIEGEFVRTTDPRDPSRMAWTLKRPDPIPERLLISLIDGTLEDGTLEITGSDLGTGGSIVIEHFSSGQFGFDLGTNGALGPIRGGDGRFEEGSGEGFLFPLTTRALPGQVVRFAVPPAFDDLVGLRYGETNYYFDGNGGFVDITLAGGERSLAVVLFSTTNVEETTSFTLSAIFLDAVGQQIPGSGQTKPIVIEAIGEPAGTPPNNTITGDQKPRLNSQNIPVLDQWGNIIPVGPDPGRNDTIFGTPANDRLIGGEGTNYYLVAEHGGNDRVEGGSWIDFAFMGADDDVAIGGNGRDRISGGPGNDRLFAEDEVTEQDAIARGVLDAGGSGWEDLLAGAAGDDLLVGSASRDVLSGGSGADRIIAGAGDDHILGDRTFMQVYNGSNPSPDSWSVQLTITPGGEGMPDVYNYVGVNLSIFPDGGEENGDDVINAGAGDDSVLAGAGDDMIYGEIGNDVLFGEKGDDVIYGGEDDDLLVGGIVGDSGQDEDWISGGNGNDQLFGVSGDDFLFGGIGDDYLSGDSNDDFDGKDVLEGGAGNDELHGGGKSDVLFGDDGDDKIYGDDDETSEEMAGADIIYGGAGKDILVGFGGADIIDGGEGDDEINGDGSETSDAYGAGDILSGGSGEDLIIGGGGGDKLYGGADDDELYGDASYTDPEFLGNDLVDGGDGNDLIFGNGAADTLLGGEGNDTMFGDGENVTPTANHGNDVMDGGAGDDIMSGDGGNDLLQGGAGNDMLFGGEGNDVLMGGEGDDQLQGGAGNDVMIAESSQDILIGGAGDDTYLIQSPDGRFKILDNEGTNTIVLSGGDHRDGAHVRMSNGNAYIVYADGSYTGMSATTFASIGNFDFGDGVKLNRAQLQSTFVPEAIANPFLPLGNGISAYDVGFRARGNDLIVVYSGAVTNWFDEASLRTNGVLYRTEDRTQYGLAAGGPDVLVLPNWYLAAPGSYVRTLLGGDGSTLEFEDMAQGVQREVNGDERDNTLTYGSGTYRVRGLGGNDIITTSDGNDFLDGGAGNDTLEGGGGNDTYRYGAGDGRDIIIDGGGDTDALVLGAGIAPTDLTITETTAGLEVRVGLAGSGNSILIATNGASVPPIEQFQFADGTVWNAAQIDANIAGNRAPRVVTPLTDATVQVDTVFSRVIPANTFFDPNVGDTLTYTVTLGDGSALPAWLSYDAATRTLSGRPGFNDAANLDIRVTATDPLGLSAAASFSLNIPPLNTLIGTAQGDTLTAPTSIRTILRGLEGNDNLTGNAGDDILEGGPGDDYLNGGLGSDTYLWNRGDGSDHLTGLTAEPASHIDTIQFGAGIAPADVRVLTNFGAYMWLLVRDPATGRETPAFSIAQGTDSTLGPKSYDRVRFADGTVWSFNETVNRGFVGGDGYESFYGNDAANIMIGNGGDDWLRGFNGNDDLRGGTGRDQLDGGAGNDTYRFARGDGYDEISDSQGTNRIVLDADILPGEVTLYREPGIGMLPSGGGGGSDDLILVLNGGQQQIRVEEYYSASTPTLLSEIAFGDGTVWNAAAIAARVINNPTVVDTFTGTAGADSFAVDNAGDRINDSSVGDGDLVTSTTNYSLPTNVENLALSGMFAIGGLGNNLDNTITGNAFANILDGGGGLDTLIGGAGDDRYLMRQPTHTGWSNGIDNVVESVDGGYDAILADRIYTAILPDNVEALIATGASIYNFWTDPVIDQRRKLVGNALDNLIDASAVSDVGIGGLVIDGGAGADLMIGPTGSIGSVRYVIDNAGDRIVFSGFSNPGSITVETTLSYTATDDAWHVDLTGTAATSATGNDQANGLSGIRNTAANVLTGGRGNDTYVVGLGDVVVENTGEGIDSVQVMEGVAGSEIDIASYANVENLSIGTGLDAASVRGDSRDNILRGNRFGNVLIGGAGNDTIYAGSGIEGDNDTGLDTLLGGAGNDLLIASGNDDILDGGSGDDILSGGGRGYEYRFGLGSGFDLIKANANSGVVRIREGVTAADIRAARDSSTLHVYIGSSDRLSFENVFVSDESVWTRIGTVPSLLLADWTTLDTAALAALAQSASGVPSGYDDVVTGTADADRLELLGGNDTVDAGTGNDIVVGGAGNDTLRGNAGDDTYRYSADFGEDIIEDSAGSAQDAGIDVVEFDASIARASVSFAHGANPDDLLISIADSADRITVRNFFAPGAASDQIELFRFADGTTVAAIELMGLPTLEGTSGANILVAGAQSTLMYGRGGNDSLTGGAGNDLLDGGEGADLMAGGAGNDRYVVDQAGDALTELAGEGIDTVESAITYSLGQQVENLTLTGAGATNATGNELDNTLRGNSAANVLNGGAGADTLFGSGGDDIYIVDDTGDTVVEADGEGVDVVHASVSFTLGANLENLTLLGSGNLDGTGNSEDNVLIGTAGANLLDGGGGVDHMEGGAGDDIYVVTAGDTVVEFAGGGVDEIRASATYTLVATLENLALLGFANIDGFGNAGNNVLTGNAGNNLLDGGAGADQMSGGAGSDTYYIDDVGDTVTEDPIGDWDHVYSSISTTIAENVETLTLTGSDNLNATGDDWSNYLEGNIGNNILDGGAGADYMYGDSGNDVYYVDDENDYIEDTSGTDEVRSSVTYSIASSGAIEILTLIGDEEIDGTGNALNNIITGNSAINQLTGGAGNDTLDGGAGADKLLGGQGNDNYVVDNIGDTITESSNQGTDVVTSSVTFTLASNVEHLTLTGAANIDATGNSSGNTLTGNSGNNRLDGKAGTDTLTGGLGDDTYVVDSTTDAINELAGQGTDTVESTVTFSINTTPLANVENITLKSTSSTTSATGNSLNNVLTGSSATNTLTGNDGDDTLNGMGGNDTLSGGNGNDILDGGTGNDGMTGGAGDDTYFVDSTTDTVTEASGGGTDTIRTTVQLSTWAANVENMTLLGTSALNVTSAMASSASNVIIGNSAVNSLNGGAGDDTLNGMGGNDTLIGGLGADTYQYSSGGGSDTIDNASSDALVDRLRFLDLASTQVRFTRSGNNLVMVDASNASNVYMTAQNWFSVATSKLDFVNFTNNEVTAAQIDALFASGGSGGVLSGIAPGQARIASLGGTFDRQLLDGMDSPQLTTLVDQAMAAETAALVSRGKDVPVRWVPIKDFGQSRRLDVGLDRLVSAMASFAKEESLDVGVPPNHEIIECGLAVGAAPESEVHMIRSPMLGRVISISREMIA